MSSIRDIILELYERHDTDDDSLRRLIAENPPEEREFFAQKARETAERYYGKDVYLRGLIEFSSYCRNDCYYCGLRRSNEQAQRYRLTEAQILDSCAKGYELDFRTFVLQGGEDPYYTDDRICSIVTAIRTKFPDCAITLSLGERDRASYQRFYDAGADRYLLRQETGSEEHYRKLHPPELSFAHRQQCLFDLKDIGYQVGCGFMVGSPYQTPDDLLRDLRFMQRLQPQMIGIGPFLPSQNTPFAQEEKGTVEQTLQMLRILRLMFPKALLPATTALGTANPLGRELGLLSGANVVMPNLTPLDVRGKYLLYDGKICTGDEAAECRLCLQRRIESVGCRVAIKRGDPVDFAVRSNYSV